MIRRISEGIEERERIYSELEEKSVKIRVLSENLVEIETVKERLARVSETIAGENNSNNWKIREETEDFSAGIKALSKIASVIESKLGVHKSEKILDFSENWARIESVKECLVRVIENIDEENKSKDLENREGNETRLDVENGDFSVGLKSVSKLASIVESKLGEYKRDKIKDFSENRSEVELVKECLVRIIENIGGENNGEKRDENETELFEEIDDFSVYMREVSNLAITAESKLREYKEGKEKEKSDKIWISLENLVEIESIKEGLNRVIESIRGEDNGEMRSEMETELAEEIGDLSVRLNEISKLASTIESKVSEYKEASEKEKGDYIKVLLEHFQKINSAKECLVRLLESIDEEKKSASTADQNKETKEEIETELGEEFKAFWVETDAIFNLIIRMELKHGEYREMREKEKRELESSVMSLTEENRDINTLLRVALAEKEVVERNLNKLKGNSEPKRGALWGLPKVGFGFMMGSTEQASDNSSVKSDSSDSEEEVVSLASTVERIMKNLRLEITQLRRSLEESRSDVERLQSLTEKQAQTISENTLYIHEMEDREAMLAQNVKELLLEIKATEEEVARWREACELEVEAGKCIVEERDKLVLILKQELEKTKAALEIANGKLKLKEDLANAAMAAQAAGERSLQLADSRVSELKARVEVLAKQLEEAENKDKIRRRVRDICWPFQALKLTSRNGEARNFKRMLPEMQALLH